MLADAAGDVAAKKLAFKRTQARLLEVRARLRAEFGRDPTKSEIAKAAGVAPGLVTRYWDRIGVGELPHEYLETLTAKVAERPAEEQPLVSLAVVLLDFLEKLTPGKEILLESRIHGASGLRYELRPANGGGEAATQDHPLHVGTGKVSIQYERVFGSSSIGRLEPDPTLEKLGTGKLELEVKDADDKKPVEPAAKQEKEAFTDWGQEVGGLQAGLGSERSAT